MKRTIFTLRMARHLIDAGFQPIAQVPNAKDLTKDVWIFERSPEFDKAFDEYIATHKRKENVAPDNINKTIAGLYFVGDQSVSEIAKALDVDEEAVMDVLEQYRDKLKLLAIAALNDADLKRYTNAASDDERNAILIKRIKEGGFVAYTAHAAYHFKSKDESGVIDGD